LPESVLEEGFAAALKKIQPSAEVVGWTRKALLESSRDEREQQASAVAMLTTRYQKLSNYISQAYEDKLEGRIELELWESKTAQWKAEQAGIERQITAYRHANTNYLEEGIRLMEIAASAADLFKTMTADEKREILGLVLSNPQIKKGTLCFNYRVPFSLFTAATDS